MSVIALAQQLQQQGRGGDTILAHITPEEAQLLESRGGSGTINPVTGLPEYGFFSDLWRGFKKVIKKIAPIIIPAIAIFVPTLIPAIGTYLGASAATASIVGAAALSAGVTLASGGSLKDVLTSAALAGAGSYLTPMLGKMIAPAGVTKLTQSMIGSAAFGAGYTALRGGTVKEILAAGATGAANTYFTNVLQGAVAKMNNMMASGQINSNINQKGAVDASRIAMDASNYKASGMSQVEITQALIANGVDSVTANYAATNVLKGMDTTDLAANIAGNRPTGTYRGDQATRPVTEARDLDMIQRIEDANFVAEDAVQLAKQGLSTTQIRDNLIASGVDSQLANTVATNARAGQTVDQISDRLVSTTNFTTTGKVFTGTTDTINRDLGVAMNAEQQASFKAIPYKDLVNNGVITIEEANVLSNQGVTSKQVLDLTKLGYTGSDISDLVGAGVKVNDLTVLSRTPFAEATINDLLMGGRTVNDISVASTLVSNKTVSLDTATKLLEKGVNGTTIQYVAASKVGAADALNSLIDKGVSIKNAYDMSTKGYDLTKVNSLVDSGKVTATTLNDTVGKGNYTSWLNGQMATTPGTSQTTRPTQPVVPTTAVSATQSILNTGLVDSVDASVLANSGYTANDVRNLIGAGYTAPDLVELASTGVPATTLTSLAQTRFPEATINDMLMSGKSANDIAFASSMVNIGATSQANAQKILNSGATGINAGGQLSTMLNNSAASTKLLDAGLDPTRVTSLISKGPAALNNAVNNIGKFDPALVNKSTDPTTSINNQIKFGYGLEAAPVTKPSDLSLPGPTTPANPNLVDVGNGRFLDTVTGNIVDSSGKVVSQMPTPGAPVDVAGPAVGQTDRSAPGVAVGGSNLSLESDQYGYRIPPGTTYQNGTTYQGNGRWTLPNGTTAIIGAGGWDEPSVSRLDPNKSYVTKFGTFGAEGTATPPTQGNTGGTGASTTPGAGTGAGTTDVTYTPGTGAGDGSYTNPTDVGTITVTPGATQPVTPTQPAAPSDVIPYIPTPIIPGGSTTPVTTPPRSTDLSLPGPVTPTVTTPPGTVTGTTGTPTGTTGTTGTPAVTTPTVTTPTVTTPPVTTPPGTVTGTTGGTTGTTGGTTGAVTPAPVEEEPIVPITPIIPGTIPGTGTVPSTVPGAGTTPGTGTTPVTVPGSGTTPGAVVTPVVPGTGTATTPGGGTTTVVPGTGTVTTPGSGTVTTPGTGTVTTPGTGTVTTPGTGTVTTPGTGTVTTPGTGTVTTPVVTPPVVPPEVVPPVVPPVVVPPVVPPVVVPPEVVPPEVVPPEVVPPEEEDPVIVPPIPPIVPEEPPGTPFFRPPVLPSITPPPLAKGGLNPGYITDVPDFYNTTNSAQSKYYWGRHAYQPGPSFNPALYNTAPDAPAQPFGIQNMSTNTLNYNQLMALAQGQQPQPAPTTQPASPVNPAYNQFTGPGPFTQPIVPQLVKTVPYNPMLSYEEYARSLTDPNYVSSQPASPVAPTPTTQTRNTVPYQPFMTYQQYQDLLTKANSTTR